MVRRGRAESGRDVTSGTPAVPDSEIAAAAAGGYETSGWLRLGRDGRLTAYASCAEGLVRWTESAPGSDVWHGPDLFRVEGWGGRFTLAQDSHGFVWFAGTRYREDVPGGYEFVIAAQYQTGRPLGDWRTVGNPFAAEQEAAPAPGDPVLLPDGGGSLHVLVTRFGEGVRGRTQAADGKWGSWTDYQGKWARGAVVPLVTSQGRAEFVAPFRGGASYWAQDRPGSAFRWLGRTEAEAIDGTYSAYETGLGIGTHFWRHPADGSVIAYRPRWGAGGVPAPLMPLGGAGGVGPVGVTRAHVNGYDCTVLLQRGAEGYPEIAAYPTHGEQYGAWWAPLGERCAGLPAIALDGYGSITIAMIGEDGGLRIARQDLMDVGQGGHAGLGFGAWRRVG
ncbi:hypothetical protein [Streptomyces sp. NPDC002990]